MTDIVTGGSDFIGRRVVADLLKDGHSVSIYDHTKSEANPDLCTAADVRDKQNWRTPCKALTQFTIWPQSIGMMSGLPFLL
jgi:nucleoside-diphosphate-sugar epimerase